MIAEMEALAEKLKASRGDSEELRKKISKLDLDLQKVLDNLTDKRGKLEEANRQLSELRQIEEETRERAVEYRRDLKAATYDLEHQVRYRLADALLGDILNEFKSLLPVLDGEGQNLFDGTLLKMCRTWRGHLQMCHLPLCELCGLGHDICRKPRRWRW